jgi:hypothetical protein
MKPPIKRFVNCRVKIKRAEKHIAEMDAILDSFHQPDSYTVREDRDPHTGQKFVEYGFAKTLSGEDLAVAIGDAVHNLRCALDYAWIHCIRKLAPAALGNFSKFPIFETRDKLEDALMGRGIQKASPRLYDLIVSDIKPYDGGDSLWAIHRMDIWDKHKLLIPILDVGQAAVTLEDDKGNVEVGRFIFTGGGRYSHPLEDNQKLMDKGNVYLDVVFEKGLPSEGLDISTTLHKFSEVVLGVVETMETFLET